MIVVVVSSAQQNRQPVEGGNIIVSRLVMNDMVSISKIHSFHPPNKCTNRP